MLLEKSVPWMSNIMDKLKEKIDKYEHIVGYRLNFPNCRPSYVYHGCACDTKQEDS